MQISNNSCEKIPVCLCCENTVRTVLDLGNQPPANSYVIDIQQPEQEFPLKLNYCDRCTHLQLSHAVDPDILFKNYLYVSGTTQTLKDYFNKFVSIVEDNCLVKNNQLTVLDIACNDGSQLNSFKQHGHNTYGIDPAVNLYETSSKSHNIICDYFTENSVSKFNTKFDAIIAQNVFAHNNYPKKFLDICSQYLNDNGSIFIQTSQADMVKYGQFDTIYHEHISFFSAKSMKYLVERSGLFLNQIIKTPIHGNSYVFIINKYRNDNNPEYSEQELTELSIQNFVDSVRNTVDDLKCKINKYKTEYPKHLVVGYGAAAKGNTVLNYSKINLDYIVDDNKLKQGLFTPGMKIPIVSLEYINNLQKNIVWIPLSWNFFTEIKNKISNTRINNNDFFIKMNFVN
jgi:2-polyprenyl-3-methyl-5-hydroxy-6-metoxy-1,4-benzoquinol methylase